MFRTPTGQTGTDAYLYEAQQIHNAQRSLDERRRRLAQAMQDEIPDETTWRMSIASKRFPDAFHELTWGESKQALTVLPDEAWMAEIALSMSRPGHVATHEHKFA